MRFLTIVICLLVVLSVRPARADETRSVFALIVTSNKSQKLARPDLHYADDDGAKYYELFRTMTPESNVTLLTEFDRDSGKLYPQLAGKAAAPSKGRTLSAFTEIAERVRAKKAQGERVDFYFVFAGHGDVDEGKGFLELVDGKLTSDELTSLVASVPSTRTHVILDSCNSFFVINARKPGGKRFATAAEAGERLNAALPNVGVFLSTSAEAETFEWSELGAGIFSHAVRSGLSGAADADGDGNVSYDELAAFVHTASKDVKNPRFRPSVFARGPSGRGREALLTLPQAGAARLSLPPSTGRVTLRDANDLPWIDTNIETGTAVSLYVPEAIVHGATIDIGEGHRAVARSEDGKLTLVDAADSMKVAARGPADLFKSLFAQPFGPTALREYQDEVSAEPPPVYGVASEDVTRMNELLWQAAESARSERRRQAVGLGATAAIYGGVGAYSLAQDDKDVRALGIMSAGFAVAPATFGVWSLLRTSREEDAYAWFNRERLRNGNSPDFMATAEARLFALAKRDREERILWRWFGFAYGGTNTLILAAGTLQYAMMGGHDQQAFTLGTAAVVVGLGTAFPLIGTFSPTYTERLADIWARDPSRARSEMTSGANRSTFTIKPTFGGTSFGLSGTF